MDIIVEDKAALREEIGDAVAAFLKSGGKVDRQPIHVRGADGGVYGDFARAIKPMPQRKAAKGHTKKRAKPAQGDGPRADWYTMIDLACELEYASRNSVRWLQAKGLIPAPCGQRSGKDVWRPEVVRETAARVAEWKKHRKTRSLIRQAIRAEAETAKAIKARVASYAKKQRDKNELAQDWGELDR